MSIYLVMKEEPHSVVVLDNNFGQDHQTSVLFRIICTFHFLLESTEGAYVVAGAQLILKGFTDRTLGTLKYTYVSLRKYLSDCFQFFPHLIA